MLENLIILLVMSFLVGSSAYSISYVVVQESGPFSVFDRLRWVLLPKGGKPVILSDIKPHGQYDLDLRVISVTQERDLLANWEMAWANDLWYVKTIKGTLHGILTCMYCFGVWSTLIISLIPLFMGYVGFADTFFVWFTGYFFVTLFIARI